jgi:N-acetylneuraminate synthase
MAKVIAEVGCNHQGNLETAFRMIKIAATYAEVDVVKFQKRNARELLTPAEYERPHPNPAFAFGRSYGLHREALELDADQHRELKACCEANGVEYSTSIWDITSAREMIALEPKMLKVPSACNLNKPLLEVLIREFPGKIHVSLGMTSPDEQGRIVDLFVKNDRNRDLIIYACTSGYPVAFEDIRLEEITRLRQVHGSQVDAVGFSGHHLGIAADVAAMTLGATWIERHFTLDRTWKGTDHAASLEPEGLRRLARDVRNVSKAFGFKGKELLGVELPTRDKLKASQVKWTS